MINEPDDLVVEWEKRRKSYYEYAAEELKEYQRYAKWFTGDMDDISNTIMSNFGAKMVASNNFINLITRQTRADLLFRNPRYIVDPIMPFGSELYTPQLARAETGLLNDWVEEADLYGEARKFLLDMLLGHKAFFKIGYSADIAVDTRLIDEERLHAQEEDQRLLEGILPKVRSTDLHTTHIAQHEMAIASMENGDLPVPKRLYEAAVAHLQAHKDLLAKAGERPSETIRAERVFIRRRNPLRVFYDPFAESPGDRDWIGETVVRRLEEVKKDLRYKESARALVSASDFSGGTGTDDDGLDIRYPDNMRSVDEADYVIIHEVIDLRNARVITWADGCNVLLRDVSYDLSGILPSGPYIEGSFMDNPLTDAGVAPPTAYESHQVTLTLLETIIATVARRTVPRTAVDAEALQPDELEKMERGLPSAIIPLQGLKGRDIRQVIQDIPTPHLPAELFASADRQVRAIERFSGRGSARSGGGDFSRTATATAVVAESTGTLVEDMTSVLDNIFTKVGRTVLRLMRRFYRAPLVAAIVGDGVLRYWPPSFSEFDINNDRGVRVIPGSTRRNSSDVQQKLLTEAYAVVAQDPILMMDPSIRVELLKRVLESNGIMGLNLDGLAEQLAALGQGNGGQAGGPDPGSRPARRAREGQEPSRAAIQQGASAPGGR